MSGKDLRLSRIFSGNKSLVLALDHGMGMGPQPGLKNPKETINKCIEGGIDAVLTSPGIADKYSNLFGRVGLIVRIDGGFSILKGGIDRATPLYSIDYALRIGGDAVACMGFVGGEEEQEKRSLQALSQYAESCALWQVPLMAEMIALDTEKSTLSQAEKSALAVRTGIEYGADFVKTPFVDEGNEFAFAIEGSFKPVLILGGGKVSDRELLTSVKKAMDLGAKGAVIGRNIWQHENPESISRALSFIVHENTGVDEAISAAKL